MRMRFPSPPILLATTFALVLAGCDALLPVTSTPIPEQPNLGQLPGPGTFTLVADTAAPPDAAPPPGTAHDADGPATGFLRPRTGADTLAVLPMAPGDTGAVAAALARAVARRGYLPRPPEKAAWQVRYRATVENREENLAPRDKLLQPRLRCDLQGCAIQQQWEHFGPPDRDDQMRRYQVGVVQVEVRNARSNDVVWRGRLSSELDETGALNAATLDNAAARLMRKLPRAPRHNPLAEPDAPATSRR